jgi:hypothetical protein
MIIYNVPDSVSVFFLFFVFCFGRHIAIKKLRRESTCVLLTRNVLSFSRSYLSIFREDN